MYIRRKTLLIALSAFLLAVVITASMYLVYRTTRTEPEETMSPTETQAYSSRKSPEFNIKCNVGLSSKVPLIKAQTIEVGNPACRPLSTQTYPSTTVTEYSLYYKIKNVSKYPLTLKVMQYGFHCPEPYGFDNKYHTCTAGSNKEYWRIKEYKTITLQPGQDTTIKNTAAYDKPLFFHNGDPYTGDSPYQDPCGTFQLDLGLDELKIQVGDSTITYDSDKLNDPYACEGFTDSWRPLGWGLCYTGVECKEKAQCGEDGYPYDHDAGTCNYGKDGLPKDDCNPQYGGNGCDYCDSSCKLHHKDSPTCGDGVVQDGEECDDGNNVNDDGCTNDCKLSKCGDGIVQPGEECDDGNNIDNDGCTNQCKLPNCGDGIVQDGEECDDGNDVNDDGCTNQCKLPVCGDGIVQDGEECDDGNDIDTDSCTNECKTPQCGDGIVQDGEECDDGNDINDDACTNQCKLPVCGDGIVQDGEACDDGNDINNDECTNECALPTCGDGIQQPGEQCDDGNNVNDDGCTNRCTLPICGDGIVQDGEQCDGEENCSEDCKLILGKGSTPTTGLFDHAVAKVVVSALLLISSAAGLYSIISTSGKSTSIDIPSGKN